MYVLEHVHACEYACVERARACVHVSMHVECVNMCAHVCSSVH